MNFDPCPEKITRLVLRAGAIFRELRGLPIENNVTTLYNETAPLLGIAITKIDSSIVNHLPSPAEMKNERGVFIVPKKPCPNCGQADSMSLFPLCVSCIDAEGGKYKTKWECSKCGYKDRSEKVFVQWLDEMGIDFQPGMKADMGIKTATDSGLK